MDQDIQQAVNQATAAALQPGGGALLQALQGLHIRPNPPPPQQAMGPHPPPAQAPIEQATTMVPWAQMAYPVPDLVAAPDNKIQAICSQLHTLYPSLPNGRVKRDTLATLVLATYFNHLSQEHKQYLTARANTLLIAQTLGWPAGIAAATSTSSAAILPKGFTAPPRKRYPARHQEGADSNTRTKGKRK